MDEVFNVELTWQEPTEGTECAALTLPAPPYAMLDALERIGAGADASLCVDIVRYHSFEFLSPILDEPDSLTELNALALQLAVLKPWQRTALEGLAEMEYEKAGRGPVPVSRLLDLAYGTDCCHVLESVTNDARLGRFLAENGFIPGADQLPDAIFERLDFAQIGREHRQNEGSVFTRGGYVEKHSELPEISKTLDLTLPKPGYTILLELEGGTHLKLPASGPLRECGYRCLDCKVPALIGLTGGANSIGQANRLARTLEALEPDRLRTCRALLEAVPWEDFYDAALLADTLEQYVLAPSFRSAAEVARESLSLLLDRAELELLRPHVNLEGYGQALVRSSGSVLTDYGLLERRDSQPVQAPEESPQWGGLEMK